MTTCISASRKLDRARKFRLVQARGICGAIRVRLVEAPFHLLRGARNLPLPLTVERTLLEQRQENRCTTTMRCSHLRSPITTLRTVVRNRFA